MNLFHPSERFNANINGGVADVAKRRSAHTHVWYKGKLSEIGGVVPEKFTRRSFVVDGKENPLHDMILTSDGTPVGIVSKQYSFIDHRFVVDSIIEALKVAHVNLENCEAEMYLGDQGAKFGFRARLNDKVWDPGDGAPVVGQIAGFNSVDGSMPFRLRVGFYRLICGNGIVLGVERVHLVRVHRKGSIARTDVEALVNRGINSLDAIVSDFKKMHAIEIPFAFEEAIAKEVEKRWGKSKAGKLTEAWSSGMYDGVSVPGLNVPCRNVWDIFNSLTWIASGHESLAKQEKLLADCNEILTRGLRKARIALN